MDFEKRLKSIILTRIIEQIEKNFQITWENFKISEEDFERMSYSILGKIIDTIYFYNQLNERRNLNFQDITIDFLMDLKGRIQLNEEEKNYIKYKIESDLFGQEKIKSIIEVLIRRVLLEKNNIADLERFCEVPEEFKKSDELLGEYFYVKRLISGDIFDVENRFLKLILDKVEHDFNSEINCGGYALEIDTCIFPGKGNNLEKNVSSILDLFPFVRLLGDTELKEDEYLVLYRCSNGHHFIKRKDDGTFVEKNECEPPRKFEGWSSSFADSPEVAFAVKKEHDIEYFSKIGNIIVPTERTMNFEERAKLAVTNRENIFEYHNHTYLLKKSKEGIYVCSNGKIVAQIFISDNEFVVNIDEDYRDYISNIKSKMNIETDEIEHHDRE